MAEVEEVAVESWKEEVMIVVVLAEIVQRDDRLFLHEINLVRSFRTNDHALQRQLFAWIVLSPQWDPRLQIERRRYTSRSSYR